MKNQPRRATVGSTGNRIESDVYMMPLETICMFDSLTFAWRAHTEDYARIGRPIATSTSQKIEPTLAQYTWPSDRRPMSGWHDCCGHCWLLPFSGHTKLTCDTNEQYYYWNAIIAYAVVLLSIKDPQREVWIFPSDDNARESRSWSCAASAGNRAHTNSGACASQLIQGGRSITVRYSEVR